MILLVPACTTPSGFGIGQIPSDGNLCVLSPCCEGPIIRLDGDSICSLCSTSYLGYETSVMVNLTWCPYPDLSSVGHIVLEEWVRSVLGDLSAKLVVVG